ncbi:hypothetical protein [Albibacterium bauzanense]|uniref:P pilus assembly chaperone PapD n=1 Tax=Albibacterium bauzanense TaxID=653929 RepID=A0A4R1M5Y7_9SPHI|nr:hypothetical protein [Albibacterium bauzanense]TCK85129.1 hypothetical protein C8N28_0427 [Albibacterium bauzanense]
MKALLTSIYIFINFTCFAQSAISTSASRIYFTENGNKEQMFVVHNPDTTYALELGLSFHDWQYDSIGNNKTYDSGTLANSLSDYLNLPSGNHITLPPGATDTIHIAIQSIQDDDIPVRTAMLYLTQLSRDKEQSQAFIQTLVQMGIKIYYKNKEYPQPKIDLGNFSLNQSTYGTKDLKLSVANRGNIWQDGKIQYELLNLETREMVKLDEVAFFSLPDDKQWISINLPSSLKKGKYVAYAQLVPATNHGINNIELIFTN